MHLGPQSLHCPQAEAEGVPCPHRMMGHLCATLRGQALAFNTGEQSRQGSLFSGSGQAWGPRGMEVISVVTQERTAALGTVRRGAGGSARGAQGGSSPPDRGGQVSRHRHRVETEEAQK